MSYWPVRLFYVNRAGRGRAPPSAEPASFLLDDLGDRAGADGAAPLADGEADPLLHGDRRDQLDLEVHVVPRHHHLRSLRKRRDSRHVRRPEVELRTVTVEKRRVTTPLFLRQDVDLTLELR